MLLVFDGEEIARFQVKDPGSEIDVFSSAGVKHTVDPFSIGFDPKHKRHPGCGKKPQRNGSDRMLAYDLENRLVFWLQTEAPFLKPLMELLSLAGSGLCYLLLFAVIYWWSNPRLGMRLFLLLLFSSLLNNLLKMALHMPRPYWVDPRIQGLDRYASFGMPSGHAQSATVTFGMLGASLKERWIWAVCVAAVFLIGFSRLHLGAHAPSQVLCGWIVGIVILLSFLKLEPKVVGFFEKKSLPVRAAICIGVAFGFLAAGLAVKTMMSGWRFPHAWISNAPSTFTSQSVADPFPLGTLVLSSSAFLGISLGAVFRGGKEGFDPKGCFWRRILRVLLGLSGALLVYLLFGLFKGVSSWAFHIWLFGRGVTAGFWVTGGSPFLFRRLLL